MARMNNADMEKYLVSWRQIESLHCNKVIPRSKPLKFSERRRNRGRVPSRWTQVVAVVWRSAGHVKLNWKLNHCWTVLAKSIELIHYIQRGKITYFGWISNRFNFIYIYRMSFICHIHNYTEYNEEWNVFSAFNPSKCTHLEQWAADCAAPGEQSWTSCRSRDSNPQPWVTSGFKSNALSIRPTKFFHFCFFLRDRSPKTVHGSHWLALYGPQTMEFNGYHQLFG